MKCPYCEYSNNEYHYGDDGYKNMSTGKNPFYKLAIPMVQERDWDKNETPLYGCPDCGKTFISVYS